MNRFQEYLEQVTKKVKGIKGTNVTFTIDEIKDIIRNLEDYIVHFYNPILYKPIESQIVEYYSYFVEHRNVKAFRERGYDTLELKEKVLKMAKELLKILKNKKEIKQ